MTIHRDYYSTDKAHYDRMIRAHRQFDNPIVFAGGAWSWSGFTPANRFSIRANEAAIRSCLENGVKDILITCWKDDCAECSLFASLPAFFAAAQFARGNFDRADIERKFLARYGVAFETFLALDELDLSSGELANPSKYMLYSDPFFGILDRTVIGKDGAVYAQIRAKLALGAKNRTFGYIFRTLMSLCDVLEYKLTLGLRTREAYRTGDRAALDALIADYRTTETRVRAFYRAFRAQWDRECRENGFENHDIRLGGLVCRLRHCRTILEEYRDGKRTRIPALEEDILPFGDAKDGQPVVYNDWLYLSIVKPRV